MSETLFTWSHAQERAVGALRNPSTTDRYLPLTGYDAIVLRLRLPAYADGRALHPFDRRAIARVRDAKIGPFATRPNATVYLRLSEPEAELFATILEDMLNERPAGAERATVARTIGTRLFCCADCHAEHEGPCPEPRD